MTEDYVSKKIWLGDVGDIRREEVNIIQRSGNYQFAYKEGTLTGPKAKPSPLYGVEHAPDLRIRPFYGQHLCDRRAMSIAGHCIRIFTANTFLAITLRAGFLR